MVKFEPRRGAAEFEPVPVAFDYLGSVTVARNERVGEWWLGNGMAVHICDCPLAEWFASVTIGVATSVAAPPHLWAACF